MKVIYKITYPNGKICVDQDLTDEIKCFGSTDSSLIRQDFTRDQMRGFTVREQMLCESEDATPQGVTKKEDEFILLTRTTK
jgi:hypothetical protein